MGLVTPGELPASVVGLEMCWRCVADVRLNDWMEECDDLISVTIRSTDEISAKIVDVMVFVSAFWSCL